MRDIILFSPTTTAPPLSNNDRMFPAAEGGGKEGRGGGVKINVAQTSSNGRSHSPGFNSTCVRKFPKKERENPLFPLFPAFHFALITSCCTCVARSFALRRKKEKKTHL